MLIFLGSKEALHAIVTGIVVGVVCLLSGCSLAPEQKHIDKTVTLEHCTINRAEYQDHLGRHYITGKDFSGLNGQRVRISGDYQKMLSKEYKGHVCHDRTTY